MNQYHRYPQAPLKLVSSVSPGGMFATYLDPDVPEVEEVYPIHSFHIDPLKVKMLEEEMKVREELFSSPESF